MKRQVFPVYYHDPIADLVTGKKEKNRNYRHPGNVSVWPLLVTSRHPITGRNQDNNRVLSPSGTVPNQMKIAHNRRDKLGEWVIREEKL